MKYLIVIITLLIGACTMEDTNYNEVRKWDNGIVYYTYARAHYFSDYEKNLIKDCMKEWEKAGVQFIKGREIEGKDEEQEKTLFICKGLGFCATLGQSEASFVVLEEIDDSTIKQITHELGHVLGLLHEHQRPDRDNYVTIHWNNLIDGVRQDYTIMNNPLYIEEDLPYDYKSIMGYGAYHDSKNGKITVENHELILNLSNKPSELDLEKVRMIYGIEQ